MHGSASALGSARRTACRCFGKSLSLKGVLLSGLLWPLSTTVVVAQSVADTTGVPRTSSGAPDLQGVWLYWTATPLERPDEFDDKAVVTAEAAADFVARRQDEGVTSGDWNPYAGLLNGRTSLLTEPPNGRLRQMWQIGYRYEQVYQAITDENWELGTHHWGKLRNVFNVALMKRPNRTPNAEDLFLDDTWQLLAAALEAGDAAAAHEAFLQERQACLSCHVAEGFEFINSMSMFEETAAFPEH